MELPALIAVLVDAILIKCPQYDRASVTVALESVFAGHPTLLGGNSISMLLGQNNDYTNATITIGDVHAGNQVHVAVQLPQPIDPLPAALAALASIPLTDVPKPRSDLPQASRLPFESSPHFVGREAELKALAQAIGTAQPTVIMPAVATGLGGIGKTSLVTEFAYRYGVYFHGGVFWLNCADAAQVASQIAACAVDLGIDPTGMALDEQVQRVLNAWKSPMPRLLIFDNCEDRAILDRWKPIVGGCRVLVTARSDHWPTLTQIRLGLLLPAESRALLQRLCARLSDAEADAIAEDLGHLPLALHLAGSYLNTYPHHTVAQYRTELTIAHQSLKGRGALPSPTRHEQDVEATFMLSFNQLDPTNALDALALGMLDGAAWCAPGVPIPRDLVLAFVPDETESDDAVDALRRLQQLGLLDGTDAVVLHRLLVEFVCLQRPIERCVWVRSLLKKIIQVLLDDHKKVSSNLFIVEQSIDRAALRFEHIGDPRLMHSLKLHLSHVTLRALKRNDEQSSRLAQRLGYYEGIQGNYQSAQKLYQYALKTNGRVLGKRHSGTIAAHINLAHNHMAQGHYEQARLLVEHAVESAKQALGSHHLETIRCIFSLAEVLSYQGHYSEAQRLYEQTLNSRKRILGDSHLDTSASYHGLASVLVKQGDYRQAQALFEHALRIREKLLGKEHRGTVYSMNYLGITFMEQGKYAQAQQLFEQALGIRERLFGIDHPETAIVLNNLGGLHFRRGKFGEAKRLFSKVLRVRTCILGRDHPDTAQSMHNLAAVLGEQQCYEEAYALHKEALAIESHLLGEDHPTTAISIYNLGGLLQKLGRYSEAKLLYEQGFDICKRRLGSEHPDTIHIQKNLVTLNERMLKDRRIRNRKR